MPIILVKKLVSEAIIPKYHLDGDAGMDLHAIGPRYWYITKGQTEIISTGIALDIPYGYFGSIRERSGLAAKGIRIGGGVVDSGYRGEIKVVITNLSDMSFRIAQGDRIAQLVIHELPVVQIKEVSELSESNRGKAGFGSSGC